MPATSQQQQKLFGLALSVKRGETPRSEASEDVLNIVDSMTEKEIEDFAGTSHKGLPKKVEEMIREMVRENLKETFLNEAGISRMYMVFLGAQKKVRELEDAQKQLLAQWKSEKDPKKKAKIFDKMKKGTLTLKKRRANLSDIERDYINNMAYDTSYSESISEIASRTAVEIGGLTGMNKDFIQKFVDDNNLDIEKVYQFVKKGKLKDRLDFVTAVAGKPNNPLQKKMIKMFSESINERLSNQDIKRMDGLHSYKKMDEALKLLVFIGRELIDEGWEKDEVTEYIQKKVARRLYLQL